MAKPCLRITDGDLSYIVPLEKPVFSIGRRLGSDLRLLSGASARDHADITLEAESCVVLNDHRSRFGTFVNDRRIARHVLTHGDRIRFGDIEHDDVVYFNDHGDLGVSQRPPTEPLCVHQVDPTPKRRCPACTEPNNFLDLESIQLAGIGGDAYILWLWSPPPLVVRRYCCRRCGHVVEQMSAA